MSKMIQLRNVPDALHRQLKARAALEGLSLSDFLIREARKAAYSGPSRPPVPADVGQGFRSMPAALPIDAGQV